MKTLLKAGLFTILAVLFTTGLTFAQARGEGERASPNAAVSQTIGATDVSITYGRPALKERTYFSADAKLAPAGKVWRTGANESTVVTFSTDVMVGDKAVKAGTYSIYTIPGAKEWTIIISKKLSWGTQYDAAEDVVRATTTAVSNKAASAEWFNIYFDTLSATKAHMNLHWGTTSVAVPISVK
tara:strand:- start:7596 stop:8147 length:552 start_codon:yes stop_codon:yes gene_type:complete